MTISPDSGAVVESHLENDGKTLGLTFLKPMLDGETYLIELTDKVIAADVATPGDRDFELRVLAGNVVSENGPGPQIVNALDIGLTGVRGHFGLQVTDPANTPFDVNQDGVINALDLGCVRITCGLCGNSAP